MNAMLLPIAFCGGIAIALQTTLNGQLARGIGEDPLAASLVSFFIGGLCLAVAAVLRAGSLASLAHLPTQPTWTLLGGALGAVALLCNVLLAPRIGLTLLVGCAVVGQLTSSLVIDHYALLGASARPVSPGKVAGYLMMVCGLAVLMLGDRVWKALSG